MNNVQIENNNGVLRISKGLVISFIITLSGIFLFSIILSYTNISERIIPIAIIFLTFISIFIGSIISTRKVNKNGMINGGLIGVAYVVLLYIVSSIINTGFGINLYTLFMMILGVISGLIGGIIGINS